MLAKREDIDMDSADQFPPHMPAPEPSRAASELVTPETYAQACVDEFSDVWAYARLCGFCVAQGRSARLRTRGVMARSNETAST